jgi:general stress protein CsbA
MVLYISTMIVENKWNLIFIKNIFGDWFYNLLIKCLSYTGKYNRIWILIGWVILVFASLVALYISDYLVNNIDIISEIVQQSSKSK